MELEQKNATEHEMHLALMTKVDEKEEAEEAKLAAEIERWTAELQARKHIAQRDRELAKAQNTQEKADLIEKEKTRAADREQKKQESHQQLLKVNIFLASSGMNPTATATPAATVGTVPQPASPQAQAPQPVLSLGRAELQGRIANVWQDSTPDKMSHAIMQILMEHGVAISVAPPPPGPDMEMEELSESEEEEEPPVRIEGSASSGSTAKPKGKRAVPKAEALKIRDDRKKKKLNQ